MPDYLGLYHRLPYFLKVAAASARGYQLRWWRYGRDTQKLIEESLERDTWTQAEWQKWRDERLEYILSRAATKIPYYRKYWQQQRQAGNKASWIYIENWPILEKEEVRNYPQAFLAEDVNRKKLYIDHTGGTTGKPILVYESRDTIQNWYALSEARIRQWNKVSYRDRWGMFGGQKIIPVDHMDPPFWVMNYGLNQLYFSVFHISRETAKYYLEALQKFSPSHLIVYPSILAVLSSHVLEQGLKPPDIKVIICNSEKVLDSHRSLIQEAFKCRVIDTYGMAELTSAGSECMDGKMHAWPEVGFLELIGPVTHDFLKLTNLTGEYIMTSLLNKDMPLIRYRNGDLGTKLVWDHHCKCGRNLPLIGSIQGRANDLIQTRDGRKLYILDSLFNGLPLVEAQLIQNNINSFTVNLVPTDHQKDQLDWMNKEIYKRITPYLGDIHLVIEPVEKILRDSNGKFNPFISKLNAFEQ